MLHGIIVWVQCKTVNFFYFCLISNPEKIGCYSNLPLLFTYVNLFDLYKVLVCPIDVLHTLVFWLASILPEINVICLDLDLSQIYAEICIILSPFLTARLVRVINGVMRMKISVILVEKSLGFLDDILVPLWSFHFLHKIHSNALLLYYWERWY